MSFKVSFICLVTRSSLGGFSPKAKLVNRLGSLLRVYLVDIYFIWFLVFSIIFESIWVFGHPLGVYQVSWIGSQVWIISFLKIFRLVHVLLVTQSMYILFFLSTSHMHIRDLWTQPACLSEFGVFSKSFPLFRKFLVSQVFLSIRDLYWLLLDRFWVSFCLKGCKKIYVV
jgi:hypothetical protein